MTQIELCALLKTVCRRVILVNKDKVVSAGTGVVIDQKGTVLTARHVVCNDNGFLPASYFISFPGSYPIAYKPVELLVEIPAGDPKFMKPLKVDLALLEPRNTLNGTAFVSLRNDIPAAGTDIIMAGYTDDVYLPGLIDEAFELRNPDAVAVKNAIDSKMKYVMKQLLCRRGMIGLSSKVSIGPIGPSRIESAVYHLDTNLTYGGSGGPVVDYEGKLIAIVSRMGITNVQKLGIQRINQGTVDRFPSNTGYAVSHHILLTAWERKLAAKI